MAFNAALLVGCGTSALHPGGSHVIVTRTDSTPACVRTGVVPLREITAAEMSPLEPMSRSTLEEIVDQAKALGANYVVVRPGPAGPEGKAYRCA